MLARTWLLALTVSVAAGMVLLVLRHPCECAASPGNPGPAEAAAILAASGSS
jgi:hypothetical protein